MKKTPLILVVALLVLAGCSSSPQTASNCSGSADVGFCPVDIPTTTGSQTVEEVWNMVVQALKKKDLPTLSLLAGREGIRFSPYEHVDLKRDIVLSVEEIKNGLAISRSFTRWSYDGSGEPIDLWIGQYFEKFVYDVDFSKAPVINTNTKIQRGNVLNNIIDVYTGKQVIEYYFSWFDTQYEGIDRRSLNLVFDKQDGQWKLIGIIHGQWTI